MTVPAMATGSSFSKAAASTITSCGVGITAPRKKAHRATSTHSQTGRTLPAWVRRAA